MPNIDKASIELKDMDRLAEGRSPVHGLHPMIKLVVTLAFIFVCVSFGKYDFTGLIGMALYLLFMYMVSGIKLGTAFYKMRFVLPLVLMVGIFNPFFDRATYMVVYGVNVSGGVVSMLTLLLKGVFAVLASFILAATTSIDSLCAGLRKVHFPGIMVSLILLTYRYIGVMMEETGIMYTAYMLRAPKQKGIHFSAWGSFLGQLLLRSKDKAEELYQSMELRGFNGDFHYAGNPKIKAADILFLVVAILYFAVCRIYNLPEMLGKLFV